MAPGREGFALVFGISAVDVLATAHGVDGGFERLAGQAVKAFCIVSVCSGELA